MSVIDEGICVLFHRQIENTEHYPKSAKLSQNGSCGGHMTHFWNFGTPYISGTVEARNFKFGTEMDGSEY